MISPRGFWAGGIGGIGTPVSVGRCVVIAGGEGGALVTGPSESARAFVGSSESLWKAAEEGVVGLVVVGEGGGEETGEESGEGDKERKAPVERNEV